MMKVGLVLIAAALLFDSDCDTQKQNQRITALESQVQELKTEVTALKDKPVEHHYELRPDGARTWRFDPSTGDTCIQLASTADWKRKETKAQSCDCADKSDYYVKMPSDTDSRQKWAANYYAKIVQPACGG